MVDSQMAALHFSYRGKGMIGMRVGTCSLLCQINGLDVKFNKLERIVLANYRHSLSQSVLPSLAKWVHNIMFNPKCLSPRQ